ncbi:MAG: hypothetical protein AAGJ08_29635 [Cyanobacteria bacterium P01_H01_bin.35]
MSKVQYNDNPDLYHVRMIRYNKTSKGDRQKVGGTYAKASHH